MNDVDQRPSPRPIIVMSRKAYRSAKLRAEIALEYPGVEIIIAQRGKPQ